VKIEHALKKAPEVFQAMMASHVRKSKSLGILLISLAASANAEKLQVNQQLKRLEVGDKTYVGVTIRKIENGRVHIMHESGTASFTRIELPPIYRETISAAEVQEGLAYDKQMDAYEDEIERQVVEMPPADLPTRQADGAPAVRPPASTPESEAAPRPGVASKGELSARVVATGRAQIAARPEDFRRTVFIGITQNEITVSFREYDARTYKQKFQHLRKLRIEASANVPASVRLNGSEIGKVEPDKQFVTFAVAAGRSDYRVELVDSNGGVIDAESSRQKTGL
jgi:hypothetical protein